MKNNLTFSVLESTFRPKGHHYDLSTESGLLAIRCISGNYRSFSNSIGEPEVFTPATFREALSRCYSDFRQIYRQKNFKEFDGADESIVLSYAQAVIDEEGKFSTYVFGGSLVYLVRNNHIVPVVAGETISQADDLIVINLTGEASTNQRFENGDFSLEHCDYPVLILKVDAVQGQAEAEPLAEVPVFEPEEPQKSDKSVTKIGAETEIGFESIADLNTSTESQEDTVTEIDIDETKEKVNQGSEKRFPATAGVLILIVLLAMASLYFYLNNENNSLIPGNTRRIDSASVKPAVAALPDSQKTSKFPKTDSIIKIYVGEEQRDPKLLDAALGSLSEERKKSPQEAVSKERDLRDEQKIMTKRLTSEFGKFLMRAQIAFDDGDLKKSEDILADAERFLKKNFDETPAGTEVEKLRSELKKRKDRIGSFKKSEVF